MSVTVTFSPDEVAPDRRAALLTQGIPPGSKVGVEILALHEHAMVRFAELARPVGLWVELSHDEFAGVYEGEGRNDPGTPVAAIAPRADAIALFVASLGSAIGEAIQGGFARNDFAAACMLDGVASAGADRMATLLAARFLDALRAAGRFGTACLVLPYSPGYCGWHISGQRKLFDRACPASIGVTLRDSFLMEPLKSVSGVLLAGPREIHEFAADYPVCRACETRGCRDRILSLPSGM